MAIKNLRSVTVIVPCRNEEMFIEKCLNSIILQDYPEDQMEILVVDGMSTDRTGNIIKNFAKKCPFMKALTNPMGFTSHALNIGIKQARGDIIMIIGAHTCYGKDYIATCVKYLNECFADNVGGVMKTFPRQNNLIAKAIALALSSQFGAGSYFRIGTNVPREVDTVFGGCYRKKIFDKIGLFNENLIRSQDWEVNLRIKRAGGKIILVPDIEIQYFPKADLGSFFRHNFEDGMWIIYPYKFVDISFGIRHYIPLIFVVLLFFSILLSTAFHIYLPLFLIAALYLAVALYFSIKISMREKEFAYLFLMPIVFFIRHFGFGLGSVWGGLKLFLPSAN